MSDQPRTLRHNGVGEADMETPEDYARLMGQASNQTIVPSEIEGSGEGSGGHVSKFSVFYSVRNLLFRGIRGLF